MSWLLLFVEDFLRTASPPSSRTLYLVLAPLSLPALIAGQGSSGLLDLALDYILAPLQPCLICRSSCPVEKSSYPVARREPQVEAISILSGCGYKVSLITLTALYRLYCI